MCAQHYFRPSHNSSVSMCSPCDELRGVGCRADATIETLILDNQYWRHSNSTTTTYRCKSNAGWTPCRGGGIVGHEGSGYCETATDGGYYGVRCELCMADNHYFDKLESRCHDCGSSTSLKTTALACGLLLIVLCGFGVSTALGRCEEAGSWGAVIELVCHVRSLWRAAGMRYKLKAVIGFYARGQDPNFERPISGPVALRFTADGCSTLCMAQQCIAAVPSVFNVVAPVGLEHYTRWMHLVELPNELENILIPPSCFGDHRQRMWIGSSWPIATLLVFS
eukprot:3145204-Prymnesium_polylepis.2